MPSFSATAPTEGTGSGFLPSRCKYEISATICVFGAMTTSTRASELLLPVLALPFFVPVVTAAAQATARLMGGRPVDETIGWLKLLAAYDLVFVAACAFLYTVIADE